MSVANYTCKAEKLTFRIGAGINYCILEPPHDKTNKITSMPSEHSDQPGHPPKTQISLGIRPDASRVREGAGEHNQRRRRISFFFHRTRLIKCKYSMAKKMEIYVKYFPHLFPFTTKQIRDVLTNWSLEAIMNAYIQIFAQSLYLKYAIHEVDNDNSKVNENVTTRNRYIYMYIITVETWPGGRYHVEWMSWYHRITRDAKRRVWSASSVIRWYRLIQ